MSGRHSPIVTIFITLSALATISLLGACESFTTPIGTEPTATSTATQTPEPTPETVEKTEQPEITEPASIKDVQKIEWHWTEQVVNEPASRTPVADPDNYTLVLWEGNTYNFKADCNTGSGAYTSSGSFITLEPGITTLAECGSDSLYDQYLESLGEVESFELDGESMVLNLEGDAGSMVFESGGAVKQPEESEVCDAGINPASVVVDPTSFPYTYKPVCVNATDYDDSQPPNPTGLPDHIAVNFLPEGEETLPREPIIYIVPVDAYQELWDSSGDQAVSDAIQDLADLLAEKPEPIPSSSLPVLPFEEVSARPDIQVASAYLDTLQGSGVRFVTRFTSNPDPITNDNPPLFYTFQGFSSDRRYLISFFYPVTTSFLPNEAEVSQDELDRVADEFPLYKQEKTADLNGLETNDWEPDLAKLDGLITSLEYGVVPEESEAPPSDFAYINWQWGQLIDTNPATFELIPDPQIYTLVFNTNGTLTYTADCNAGDGNYTINGDLIEIKLGATAMKDCGTTSFSPLFIELLEEVETFERQANSLTLYLPESPDRMIFLSGGTQIVVPTPAGDTPQAVAKDAINIRSGPGTEYLTYGVVPQGTTFEVIGVSEDLDWWVIAIPKEITIDGMGWVSADFVDTTNTENVPVEATPSLKTVDVPEPVSSAPTATFVQSIEVYRGPGTEYASYGVVGVGTRAEVVGVSEDGQWWVIEVDESVNPDKQAWVDGRYVQVTNLRDIPVIPTPPLQ
ncbi:MAG: META domain-containing protein [Anaerolineales bacterium]